jgi:hypothetical protein
MSEPSQFIRDIDPSLTVFVDGGDFAPEMIIEA